MWIGLILLWVVAHLLVLGPIQDAAELAVAWLAGIIAASAVIASLTVLGFGLVVGRTSPAWLRFVAHARSAAAVIGCGLVLVGLLHYRDTEPAGGDITWVVGGVAILVGAGVVHGWLVVTQRRHLA